MKFEDSFDFEYSASTIMRMFTDRNYFIEKLRRLNGVEPEIVGDELEDDRFSITMRQPMDVSEMPLPDILRKRVGERLTLNQTDAWHIPTRTGRVEIEVETLPVTIGIDMHLVERDAGSRHNLTIDIQADVPLLGKKIEKAMADPIKQRMRKDLEVSSKIAADYME